MWWPVVNENISSLPTHLATFVDEAVVLIFMGNISSKTK